MRPSTITTTINTNVHEARDGERSGGGRGRIVVIGLGTDARVDHAALEAAISAALEQNGYTVTVGSTDDLGGPDEPVTAVVLMGSSTSVSTDLAAIPRTIKMTDAPVIAVVESSRLSDRVVAFALGAADVLPAPFDPDELPARVRAITRRTSPVHPASSPRQPAIVVDLTAREVVVEGRTLQLANREFELLAYLAEHPRRAFTREELLQAVWGSSAQWQDPATVTEHVRRIRAHLANVDGASGVVQTVRGHGYRFVPPVGSDDGMMARPAYS